MRKLFLTLITGVLYAIISPDAICQNATWHAVSLPHDTLQAFAVDFATKDSGFVGTLLGEMFKTTDGGTTWQRVVPGLGFYTGIRRIISTKDGKWIVSSFHGVKSSTDFGKSWVMMALPPSGMFDVKDCWFADGQHGIIVVQWGTVSVTSDGGASWRDLPLDKNPIGLASWNCVAISNNGDYCVGDLDGKLIVSTDSGTSWVTHEVENMIWRRTRFLDDTTIIAIGNKAQDHYSTISISRDKGQSWEETIVDSVGELITLDFVNANQGMVISTFGIGYFTFDSGKTWTRQDIAYGDPGLDDVCVVDDSVAYVVGPNLILRTNNNRLTSVVNYNQFYEHTCNVTVYPNPASEYITVRCAELSNSANPPIVTICTTIGETLLSRQTDVVGGEVRINLSNLPNGPYMARISSNEVNETRTFIICR